MHRPDCVVPGDLLIKGLHPLVAVFLCQRPKGGGTYPRQSASRDSDGNGMA